MLGQVPVNSHILFLSIPTPFSPYEVATVLTLIIIEGNAPGFLNPCLSSSVTGETLMTVTSINH